jgi:hypothetical protein
MPGGGGLPGAPRQTVVHPQALVGQSIKMWVPAANEWITADVTVSTHTAYVSGTQ